MARIYDCTKWRKLREYLIIDRGSNCARCNKKVDNTKELILHHIEPVSDIDYKKNWDTNNLELICHCCHNFQHDRFQKKKEVIIVWGSPLSGKNTYVKEVSNRSDVIVDIDNIHKALTTFEEDFKKSALTEEEEK